MPTLFTKDFFHKTGLYLSKYPCSCNSNPRRRGWNSDNINIHHVRDSTRTGIQHVRDECLCYLNFIRAADSCYTNVATLMSINRPLAFCFFDKFKCLFYVTFRVDEIDCFIWVLLHLINTVYAPWVPSEFFRNSVLISLIVVILTPVFG